LIQLVGNESGILYCTSPNRADPGQRCVRLLCLSTYLILLRFVMLGVKNYEQFRGANLPFFATGKTRHWTAQGHVF